MSWLVPALSDLEKARPERTLHVYFSNGADLLDRTEDGSIDAMISSQRLTSARVAYASLHEEGYVFVGAPRLLDRRPLRRPEEAAAHTLLDTSPELPLFRYFLDAHPQGEVWAFGRHAYLGTIAAIRHRVLEGAGVAVLPRYFIRDDLKQKRLKALQGRVKLQSDFFRLVWRAGHPRARELTDLAEALRRRPLR
jgi:LysR family transcriptional regulator, glycine cleavage system transcriptional activator